MSTSEDKSKKNKLAKLDNEIKLLLRKLHDLRAERKEIERGKKFRRFMFKYNLEVILREDQIWETIPENDYTTDDIHEMIWNRYGEDESILISEWTLTDSDRFDITEIK